MGLELFSPISGKLNSDALRELRRQADENRIRAYDLNENAFQGGELMKQYLIRHPGEKDGPWYERRDLFADCGISSRAGGSLISSLVGHDIKRNVDGWEDTAGVLAKVYADSRMPIRQRMLAQNQVVCGDAFAGVFWSDALQMLLVHSIDPGNVDIFTHDDDPMREWMVVEHRIDWRDKDGKAMVHWAWTDEQKNLVDDDGVELDQGDGTQGWQPNPYETIPIVHCVGLPLSESYWGRSPIAATVELHKSANNLKSKHHRLIVMQAHSLLTISDHNFDESQLLSGESNALVLSAEGRAAFLAPGADIASVERAYTMTIDEAFQLVGMPVAILHGGEVPSGQALMVAFQPKTEIVNDLAVSYGDLEAQIMRKICIIGLAHGLALPKDPVPDIDLGVEVYPADAMAAREQARLDWIAGLLLTEDYVVQFVLPSGASQESIDEYVAKLDAQSAAKAKASNPFAGSFGGNAQVPPEQRESLL